MKKTNQVRRLMNRLIQFAQDANESQLEEQEKGEIEKLKELVGQAAPLMDQLAALPTIMAKTQMEEEAAEDEDDPDTDLLAEAAKASEGEAEDGGKAKEEGGMDAKEIRKLIEETVQARMPKLAAPAQVMDAKEIFIQISKRDALAKQLVPFTGAFDAAEMSLDEVARYAVKKLQLPSVQGAELATISGYLHNRVVPQPLCAFGQDSKTSGSGSWLDRQTNKEG